MKEVNSLAKLDRNEAVLQRNPPVEKDLASILGSFSEGLGNCDVVKYAPNFVDGTIRPKKYFTIKPDKRS